ncbi:MAG TPA: phosphoribosylanthranilate isomerase [Rhodocyclaceae bacterium]|nr:phosphoribosylanthranilate isomerase [Rhodocyclaceae bacterium]
MSRTRIKICGLTRSQDLQAAVAAGADAVGLVFYPPSPRFVTIPQAQALAADVLPFVSLVGLFVNAQPDEVRAVLAAVPLQLLQFHGDEDEAYCKQFGRPYIKAARVQPGLDLIEYATRFPSAQGILLDAYVDGYGGGGQTFDWSLIPGELPLPVILSGGLNVANVTDAVLAIRPAAVDVSSGVEQGSGESKGIKDAAKITAFIAGVKKADV